MQSRKLSQQLRHRIRLQLEHIVIPQNQKLVEGMPRTIVITKM